MFMPMSLSSTGMHSGRGADVVVVEVVVLGGLVGRGADVVVIVGGLVGRTKGFSGTGYS